MSYEPLSTFTHTSAATVAASSTAALPVSVARKSRIGRSRCRAQAVRPEKGWDCVGVGSASLMAARA